VARRHTGELRDVDHQAEVDEQVEVADGETDARTAGGIGVQPFELERLGETVGIKRDAGRVGRTLLGGWRAVDARVVRLADARVADEEWIAGRVE